ncbi:MAG: LysR family transcriptional regulator, partial [Pseudomonadales bacterium]|nr:LysR family transcriptional regulator [Pseudomonadales bacterium]
MDINQIRYFLALSDTLNFTRAAEQCFVSQPALTQAIKRLEDELGGSLIYRDGRDTRLTALGRVIRGHFESIDKTRKLVKETAESFINGDQQELHIGLMCTVGPCILREFLAKFQSDNPGVMLLLHDVRQEDIPDLIRSGALDGAFGAYNEQSGGRLKQYQLYVERMMVAFPEGHAFESEREVPLSSIADQPYIDRLNCDFRDEFIDYCEKNSLELSVVFRSQREDWVHNFVRKGDGVTIVPEYSVLPPIISRPVSAPSLDRNIGFSFSESSMVSEIFTEFL